MDIANKKLLAFVIDGHFGIEIDAWTADEIAIDAAIEAARSAARDVRLDQLEGRRRTRMDRTLQNMRRAQAIPAEIADFVFRFHVFMDGVERIYEDGNANFGINPGTPIPEMPI